MERHRRVRDTRQALLQLTLLRELIQEETDDYTCLFARLPKSAQHGKKMRYDRSISELQEAARPEELASV